MGTFDGVLHEHTSQESDRWAFGDYPGAVYVAHATVFVLVIARATLKCDVVFCDNSFILCMI